MWCHSDERVVRVRRGEGSGGQRLQREAELLGRGRHPGIEELLSTSSEAGTVEVVTACVSGTPTSKAVHNAFEVAGVMAVLATTVADLHDIGIAHGGIDDAKVVVGADGRPVLVGFEHATAMDGPSRRWPASALAAADVAALGALTVGLLEGVGATRPSTRRPRPTDPSGRLYALADRASPKQGGRPTLTARALAEAVLAAVPAAALPGQTVHAERREVEPAISHGARRRAATVALSLAALGTVAAVSTPLACGSRRGRVGGPVVGGLANVPTGLAAFAGGVLTVGSDKFALGGPGDAVVLGRWTCAKAATIVLVRATTGTVWVFPRWPSRGAPVQAVAAGRVPTFVAARPVPAGPCDNLLVTRADGSTVTLRPRAVS